MKKMMMRKVADAIEAHGPSGDRSRGLNMLSWQREVDTSHECGTSACVAGWASILDGHKTRRTVSSDYAEAGRIILGLTEREADELFRAQTTAYRRGLRRSDVMRAINEKEHLVPAALRWMADNETIDWEQALDAACEARDE